MPRCEDESLFRRPRCYTNCNWNDQGKRVKVAGPSVPVEVLGLNGTPEAGDVLNVVETEAQAREIAEYRANAAKEKRAAAGAALCE